MTQNVTVCNKILFNLSRIHNWYSDTVTDHCSDVDDKRCFVTFFSNYINIIDVHLIPPSYLYGFESSDKKKKNAI